MHLAALGFVTLQPKERVKAALLAAWFFFTVATLWLLKSVRVASLLAHLGARETPYVGLVSAAVVGITVVLYSAAVSRLSRVQVVRATSAAFAAALLAFWLAIHLLGPEIAARRSFVWAVYVLVDVYAVVMVELFWTYASDVVTQPEADRLYGIIGLGGILGGAFGGGFVDLLAKRVGPVNLLAFGAILVIVSALLGSLTEHVLSPPETPRRLVRREDIPAALEGMLEVGKSRYLLLVVCVVVAYEFAATLANYGVNVVFDRAHLGEAELARMYGRLGWIASATGVVAQLAIVPLLLPTKRVALLVPPVAMLASVVGVLCLPILATAFVMAVVDRGLNYSVQQSTRESLYVPLTHVQKYKAKAFIDMFVDRAAKASASVLLLVLVALEGGSVRLSLAASCAAMILWIGSARRLGAYHA
jgi:AAA family ATP:ADP antiporter